VILGNVLIYPLLSKNVQSCSTVVQNNSCSKVVQCPSRVVQKKWIIDLSPFPLNPPYPLFQRGKQNKEAKKEW